MGKRALVYCRLRLRVPAAGGWRGAVDLDVVTVRGAAAAPVTAIAYVLMTTWNFTHDRNDDNKHKAGWRRKTKGNAMNKPKWSQDEAVAFVCARECITDMMGICSTAIADEESQTAPDAVRLAGLEKNLVELARERATLTLADQDKIATIRREYGAQVRAHRAQHQM